MMNYLANYGIKRIQIDYDEIDITDQLRLQDQINASRKNYSLLLSLLDDIQEKILECSSKLKERGKQLIEERDIVRGGNNIFNSDDIYVIAEVEMEALKSGMQMVNAHIDFCKNDLRILNSVFYNKF